MHGVIPFVRFMELALYCPDCGFYDKESDTVGTRGDYYTSVSVGNLFGQLLAFQFSIWCREIRKQSDKIRIVETGAHDGQLSKDILNWMRAHDPDLSETVEFWIVEPLRRQQSRQQQTLVEFKNKIHWVQKMTDIGAITGIVYSNELLDAMPVRRFGWDLRRRRWFEWGVGVERDRFVWQRIEVENEADKVLAFAGIRFQPDLLAVLPDGFTVEVSHNALAWWEDAANSLQYGKLLTFDYGLKAEKFLLPERKDGTLRSYHHHRIINDVLANPGDQDITAHVNFTAIQSIGEATGLRTEVFQTQTKFLTGIASRAWEADSGFGQWTTEQTRQFQTLTHPDHLGRSFSIIVQAR